MEFSNHSKNEVQPKNLKSRKLKRKVMMKVTVLYGQPTDPAAFEKYYEETHFSIVAKMDVAKIELTKFLPGPDGSAPTYYRMAELYFASPEDLQHTFASPEGQATSAEMANFSTGGVTMLIGMVND
jgi:uncharacterized protein (TIGR02118 family)